MAADAGRVHAYGAALEPLEPHELDGCAIYDAPAATTAAEGAKPFAMGLWDEGLEAFAQERGATTWK